MYLVSIKTTFSKELWVNEVLPLIGRLGMAEKVKLTNNECHLIGTRKKKGSTVTVGIFQDFLLLRSDTMEYRFNGTDKCFVLMGCLAHKFGDLIRIDITSDLDEEDDEFNEMREIRHEIAKHIEPNYDLKGFFRIPAPLKELFKGVEIQEQDDEIIIF